MKKLRSLQILISLAMIGSFLVSCEDLLEEETFTVLSPNDFFNTGDDLDVVLNSVYGELRYSDIKRDAVTLQEVNTDIALERGGGIFTFNEPIEEFTWTSSHQWLRNMWERRYRTIFRTNVVLDNAEAIEMNENRKRETIAETRFLRAFSYYLLYDLFGPVPLITSSQTTVTDRPSRATEEEIISFIESELIAAADVLPVEPRNAEYGRATKGAALGILAKFYMMTKRWEDVVSVTREVMDLGIYDLFTQGDRTELFSPENQRDNEFIFVAVMSDNPDDNTGDG